MKGTSVVLPNTPPTALVVSTLRCEGLQVGELLVVGGLLPLRITSATPPFSTMGPSGTSLYLPSVEVGHVPLAKAVSAMLFQLPCAFWLGAKFQ